MATKYLDSTGVGILWNKTKEYANARKTEIINQKGTANGFASLDANGKVPLAQLGNLDTSLYVIPADNKLPTTDIKTNRIYLIKDNSETNNVYTEYIYVNSAWEMLGKFAVKVDLTPYATKTYVDQQDAKKVDTTTYTTDKNTINTALGNKADKSALSSYVPTQRISTTRISAPDTNILTKKASDESYIMRGGDSVNGEFNFNRDEAGLSVTIDATDGLTVTDNDSQKLTCFRQGGIQTDKATLTFPSTDGTIATEESVKGKYVAQVTGKGLSTNDYTTTEKNKLSGIAEGANKTVVDAALNTTSANPVQNKIVASSINTINTSISTINTTLGNKLNTSDIAAITSTELATILV